MSDEQSFNLEEQEREEILEEIDELVATNRIPVNDDMEKLKPQKSGAAFPLIINILAIAAVISTFYFSSRLFEQKQETLSSESTTYLSAEGKLIEELKRESEEKLRQKEQEISSIQNELSELDRQSRELAANMNEQISRREAELRQALEQELEQEKQKLRAEGKTEAVIQEELKRIELARSSEHEEELASFRAETEKQIAAKEEELARARQINEELLAEVNSEKERIQQETQQRETELTARFEAEKAALAEEAAAAEAQLEQLTANQARESLIIDQINGSYESIFEMIAAGNSDAALAQLQALRQLVNDPSVASLKSVNKRNENDRNMIELLKQKIEESAYKEDVDTRSLTEAADLLLSAQEIAALGTEAYKKGNFTEATDYYTRSMEKIPAIKQAWQNINLMEKEKESGRLEELISQGRNLEQSGLHSDAVLKFAEAAGSATTRNPALLEQAVAGILGASDTAMSKLESDSSSEITRLKNLVKENEINYSTKLDETGKEWENRLSGVEADYKESLAEAKSSLTTLESKNNEEIERLTRLVGERDQENLRLNAEKEEALKTISEGESYIAGLEAELASTAEEMKKLKEQLAEAAEKSRGTEEQQSVLSAREEELKAQLADAEAKYTDLEDRYTAQQNLLDSKLKTAETTGYNNGLVQGRTSAMEDIIAFTSYLDGSTEPDAEARARIAELSEKDAEYQEAVIKIQNVATSDAGPSTEAAPVKQKILVGPVTYASGNQIIIEPLTDLAIDSGTKVTIMRRDRGQQETYVTFGIITSVSSGRITARTDPAGAVPARSMDLVYINQ